ncbi:MAG TPA: AEC family transporter [Hyphomicrobiales bacterium]|nr:AEC family transporter [Kaistiaceae bacterium]HQF31831.1 AEC family transporter [Hyphomicrobiales bacterium]
MTAFFESLLPVFLVIVVGAIVKRRLVPDDGAWQGFELITYYVMIPALLFSATYKADLGASSVSTFTLTLLAAVLTMGVIALSTRWPMRALAKVSDASFTTVFQTATRWNGFIALAVVSRLYGESGLTLVAVAMAIMVPVINIENVAVLTVFGSGGDRRIGAILFTIVKNPLIWSTVAGIVVNLLGIRLYGPIETTLDILGRGALAATLFLVGAGLALNTLLKPSLPVVVASTLKLAVMPVLVFLWGYNFGLDGNALMVAIVCGAVPAATNGYVLARRMGGDAPLYATTTTIETLLSFLTMPLALYLAGLASGQI